MRTTLTIEPDVAAAIARRREQTGENLKRTINGLLRAGLNQQAGTPSVDPVPPTVPRDLGELLVPSLDNIAEVLATLEGDLYR